jgi:triosephosphate isomerase (TIM)
MRLAAAVVTLLLVSTADGFSPHQTHARQRALSTSALAMAVRKPFITGNWKMNPTTKQEALDLAKGVAAAVSSSSPADVAIFVPYPFIECVQNAVGDKLIVGAEVSLSDCE